MSARILPFPSDHPARVVHLQVVPGDADPVAEGQPFSARRRYSLSDMILLCGLEDYERRTAIDHLRLYARHNGLPLPRNARVHRGKTITGPDAIGSRSTWDALVVDAWFDNPQPPQGGAAAATKTGERPAPVSAPRRAAMSERARLLAGA